MLERIAEKVGARTEIDAQSESSSAGEQRLENKPIRHTCFSHLAGMSFQTDTPKPTKTNVSADGSENELPGDRQFWNSIMRNLRAVSSFLLLRVYTARVNGRIVTRMPLFAGALLPALLGEVYDKTTNPQGS